MNKPYRCALAGLGRIAWRFDAGAPHNATPQTHTGAFVQQSSTVLLGGYSPSAEDRSDFQTHFKIPAWSTFDELLEAQPDIVSICSPAEHHFEQTMACIERNVPMVWLEKPPAQNLEDLETMLRRLQAPDAGTKVLVNYSRRYSNRYSRLRTVLQQQLLGEPLGLTVSYSRGLELNGSHFLDLVFFLLGDTTEFDVTLNPADRLVPSPSFLLRTPSGLSVTFCGFDAPYHVNDVVLTATGGRLSVLSGGLDVRVESKTPNKPFPGFFRLEETTPDLLESPADDPFSAALADLLRAHKTNSQPSSSLWTARGAQAMIARVRASGGCP